jgi:hypothetical protein
MKRWREVSGNYAGMSELVRVEIGVEYREIGNILKV